MIYKKFDRNDIFYNTIVAKPSYHISIFDGTSSINNVDGPLKMNQLHDIPYYQFMHKTPGRSAFKTVTREAFDSSLYGTRITSSYPLEVDFSVKFIHNASNPQQCNSYVTTKSVGDTDVMTAESERVRIKALKNILNYNSILSPHYVCSSSLGNKETQDITIVDIPSMIYGSSLEKGTVSLSTYITGVLAAKIEDVNKNGELIETTGSNTGSVAGVVLYDQGIILLTGSWNINEDFEDIYTYCPETSSVNPKWIYWGASHKETTSYTTGTTFSLDFESKNEIQTITMLTKAEVGEFNYSNNQTMIDYEDRTSITPVTSSTMYKENDSIDLINLVSSSYSSANFDRVTYISKVGIYDKDKNLIAIAQTKVPIKKTQSRDYIIKLKLDL